LFVVGQVRVFCKEKWRGIGGEERDGGGWECREERGGEEKGKGGKGQGKIE
jgi:hypothetical protein